MSRTGCTGCTVFAGQIGGVIGRLAASRRLVPFAMSQTRLKRKMTPEASRRADIFRLECALDTSTLSDSENPNCAHQLG